MNQFSMVMMVTCIVGLALLIKVIDIETSNIHINLEEWEKEIQQKFNLKKKEDES